jgi:hypothetical protein
MVILSGTVMYTLIKNLSSIKYVADSIRTSSMHHDESNPTISPYEPFISCSPVTYTRSPHLNAVELIVGFAIFCEEWTRLYDQRLQMFVVLGLPISNILKKSNGWLSYVDANYVDTNEHARQMTN